MEACREALNTRDAPDPPTDDVVHLIALILKKKNFSFNKENYLQKHGTVMGTWMAPSFANIFNRQVRKEPLRRATHKPIIWWRYIDDILAIWTHSEEKLIKFIDNINTYHATIKFTTE